MTASTTSPDTGASPSKHTAARIAVPLIGLATVILGVVLLFNPVEAARTLAWLLGLSFVVGGLLEVAVGWESPLRWGSVVLGGVLVVGGIVAMAWPEATLWTLALITGLSLVLHGIGRIVLALVARSEVHGRPWLLLAGALGLLAGILALAWPEVTVLVLSLVLGAQITALGLLLMAAAFLPAGATSHAPSGA